MLDFVAVGPEELKVLPRAKEKRNPVRSPAQNMLLKQLRKGKCFDRKLKSSEQENTY